MLAFIFGLILTLLIVFLWKADYDNPEDRKNAFFVGVILASLALFVNWNEVRNTGAYADDTVTNVEKGIEVNGFKWAEDLSDAHSATCRVAVSGARGTGTFVGVDVAKNRGIVLTNYHVVSKNTDATLSFWTNGVLQTISGQVIARYYDASEPYDFALISVNLDELKRINPPFIPLAGADAAPDVDSLILSAGCPKGRFAQAWKGKVLGYYNGTTILFQPPPVPGQSGSAIVNEIDGRLWVTGILTWLLGTEGSDDSRGGAIPIANLYRAIKGQKSATGYEDSPIPPNATECSTVSPLVVEFTQNDCPPCVKAKEEIKRLEQEGIIVESYNVSTSKKAQELAQKYGVQATPTWIIFDDKRTEITRYEGIGYVDNIITDWRELNIIINTLNKAPPKEEEQKDSKEPEKIIETVPIDIIPEAITNIETQSFRLRRPIYEGDYNTSFLEDSNKRWLNRERPNAPTLPENIIPTPKEPKIDEDSLSDKIGGRIQGRINDAISKQIDSVAKTIESRVEEKINAKVEEFKKYVKKEIFRLKWRLILAIVIVVMISVLFADCIKACFAFTFKRIFSFTRLKMRLLFATQLQKFAKNILKETEQVSETSQKTN